MPRSAGSVRPHCRGPCQRRVRGAACKQALESRFGHGVVSSVIGMQVISTLICTQIVQRTRGVAQRRLEVDDTVEPLALANPCVDLLAHLLASGMGVFRAFVRCKRAEE